MVPAQVIQMDKFPQLPNGKVDRVGLQSVPKMSTSSYSILNQVDSMTSKVMSIFGKIFKNQVMTPNSNFVELGGNSLLTFQLSHLVMIEFGIQIPAACILNNPVVSQFAMQIDFLVRKREFSCTENSDDFNFEKDFEAIEKFPLQPLQLAYVVERTGQDCIPIHDYLEFACHPLNVEVLEESLNRVIAGHDMLRFMVEEENQRVLKSVPRYSFQVYDVLDKSDVEIKAHLEFVRGILSHEIFDLTKFPCFDVRLS